MKQFCINIARKLILFAIVIFLFVGVIPAIAPMAANTDNTDYSVCAASKVFYARYSKKYHSTKRCRSLRRSKVIYSTTKAKAKRKGLTKCKLCW